MRILSCILMMAGCLAAQDAKSTTPAPAAKDRLAVPKDAVQTSPGHYRWTDKNGKVWIYRLSPFGVSRYEAGSGYDKQDAEKEEITAVEQGDSIRFERTSPFGKRSWVRKKSELTADEKALWERQQKNTASRSTAEKE